MGATLIGLSVQALSDADLHPGMPDLARWLSSDALALSVVQQRVAVLSGIFALALLATILTTRISAAIERGSATAVPALVLVNVVAGALSLALYVFTLVTK